MLFDNDLSFLSFLNLGDNNKSNNIDLYNTTEGFIKGNLFVNEYKPYKDYKPCMIKTCCEKTAKLYKIMELEFAINDLNLYLDLHPNDNEIFTKYKEYVEALCHLEKEYVKCYGPIKLTDNTGNENMWVKSWPWESEDSKYV